MKKHLKVSVKGKVQGVFYRASTKQKADELGIKGFVRNEPDGSVYIEMEGEGINLIRMVEWCRLGPDMARVDEVTYEEFSDLEAFGKFKIKY